MGTVQKIIEAINRISEDKKTQINARFTEHSLWMSNELALIRQLIKSNSRDNNNEEHNENSAPVANAGDVPAVAVDSAKPPKSSSGAPGESTASEGVTRQKRKSPEIAVGHTGESSRLHLFMYRN
jgi:hypothetical protein